MWSETSESGARCLPIRYSARVGSDMSHTAVYGKPQYAGGFTTSNFNITMGMKVLLTNPFIGNSCYIGTDSNPISLSSLKTYAQPAGN